MSDLIKETFEHLKLAHVPYSNFRVAACVKTKNNEYFGVNIENASYGLSNCAERSALFSAYSQGVKKEDIEEMILVTRADKLTYPCGACRQVMLELLPTNTKITITNEKETKIVTMQDLMPYAFDASDLEE